MNPAFMSLGRVVRPLDWLVPFQKKIEGLAIPVFNRLFVVVQYPGQFVGITGKRRVFLTPN